MLLQACFRSELERPFGNRRTTIRLVNVGIVGLGFMGATHLTSWMNLPDIRVKAVAARNAQARSGDFSKVGGNLGHALPSVDLSNVSQYGEWRDLVADPDIDAVDICLPTDLHEGVTAAALATGKHVLCEKPMALTAEQCEAMLSGARSADRVLMIGHVLRFWPAYVYLRDFVSS